MSLLDPFHPLRQFDLRIDLPVGLLQQELFIPDEIAWRVQP